MTAKKQVWKCNVCGNVIEILHEGADALVCCGVPMVLQIEHRIEDEGKEKHVPVINGMKVVVGSVAHPMEEKHYIEWIEGMSENGETTKVFLKPDDLPEAEFSFRVISARVYCNIHGLWKS
ncbi:MAG: desulfoferrodoxin [archaeon]